MKKYIAIAALSLSVAVLSIVLGNSTSLDLSAAEPTAQIAVV